MSCHLGVEFKRLHLAARRLASLAYDHKRLAPLLTQVHRTQAICWGACTIWGWICEARPPLRVLTEDVLKTSEIESEKLNPASVRSSIARRLSVDIGALAPTDRQVDGVVDMVLDATQRHHELLTADRLFGWHAALFPTGYSSLTKIRVGQWRDDAHAPMQVMSGAVHRQKVHYESSPAQLLDAEMLDFLAWFNADQKVDGVDVKLTSRKWAAIGKCSQDTALRDITDLVEHGALKRSEASGRSNSYELMPLGDPG